MAMKKFINDPGNLTQELLEGYVLAYCDKVGLQSEKLVVRAKPKDKDKVALVTLGGAGHEPALSGFVGEGMLDVSVVGDIFAAPPWPPVVEALRKMDRPAGVLFVVLNHEGDVRSANRAMQAVEKEGLNVRMILTHEDIAPGPNAPMADRRGLVGCIPLYKVAGAAAEAGKSLDEVYAIAERFNDNMASLLVGAKVATHPQTGMEIGALADDEIDIGMGQHGEGGSGRCKLTTADETAEKVTNMLLGAVKARQGDRLLVLLNGMGATTLMELYLLVRKVKAVLDGKGMEMARARVGEFLTAQEMGGFQMFLARMDDELLDLWDAPCDTPYYTVR